MLSVAVPLLFGKKDKSMKFSSFLLTLCLSLCVFPVAATEPSALGPVYPVIEPDLLALIKQHAAEESANTASRLNKQKEQLRRWAKEPIGQTLPEAVDIKRYRFESSAEAKSFLGEDYQREWLFIDASRPQHLNLARTFYKEKNNVRRVILVSGSVERTQNAFKQRVWFDQAGTLVKRLQIKALPTFVKMDASGITVTQAPVSDFLKRKDLQ